MTDGVLIGTARGIDQDGALIVEDEGRELRRIIAGDVVLIDN
jgi:biotin-(acetyl-CoA carboxylase) ligase